MSALGTRIGDHPPISLRPSPSFDFALTARALRRATRNVIDRVDENGTWTRVVVLSGGPALLRGMLYFCMLGYVLGEPRTILVVADSWVAPTLTLVPGTGTSFRYEACRKAARRQPANLHIERRDGRSESVPLVLRIDTPIEVAYFSAGGILPYVLEQLLANQRGPTPQEESMP